MRENPWHLRTPTTEHQQWFKNLVELHKLTESWRAEAHSHSHENPALEQSHLGRKVKESLWILEKLPHLKVEDIMDDTLPEDAIGRLEHVIWAVQAGTLQSILLRQNPPSEGLIEARETPAFRPGWDPAGQRGGVQTPSRPSLTRAFKPGLIQNLKRGSWSLGKKCAHSRWRPQGGLQDLRKIYLALHDTPFSGYPNEQGLLIKRATRTEIELELRFCPHFSPYQEVGPVSETLCLLHTNWIKGFASEFNSEIVIHSDWKHNQCTQRWSMA